MKLLVLRKNFLKQRKKEGEPASFCCCCDYHCHHYYWCCGLILLWWLIFFSLSSGFLHIAKPLDHLRQYRGILNLCAISHPNNFPIMKTKGWFKKKKKPLFLILLILALFFPMQITVGIWIPLILFVWIFSRHLRPSTLKVEDPCRDKRSSSQYLDFFKYWLSCRASWPLSPIRALLCDNLCI